MANIKNTWFSSEELVFSNNNIKPDTTKEPEPLEQKFLDALSKKDNNNSVINNYYYDYSSKGVLESPVMFDPNEVILKTAPIIEISDEERERIRQFKYNDLKAKSAKKAELERIEQKQPKETVRNIEPMKAWKHIDRVGFEIEGAWINLREDLHEDLSFSRQDFPKEYRSVGEYVSKPINNPDELFKDLAKNWVDASCPKCGFHVHVSVKSIAMYAVCMDKSFYEGFLVAMDKWGKNYPCKSEEFWTRLAGKNRYCKREFIPDIQARHEGKGHNRENRRTQINYPYSYTKTIECRLFPVFKDADTAISATKAWLNYIEEYLETHSIDEKIIQHKEIVDLGEMTDVFNTNKIRQFNLFKSYDKKINKNAKLVVTDPVLKPDKEVNNNRENRSLAQIIENAQNAMNAPVRKNLNGDVIEARPRLSSIPIVSSFADSMYKKTAMPAPVLEAPKKKVVRPASKPISKKVQMINDYLALMDNDVNF